MAKAHHQAWADYEGGESCDGYYRKHPECAFDGLARELAEGGE